MRLMRKLYMLSKVLKIKKAKKEEILRIQQKRLNFMINYCYKNVPFYHYLWKKSGIRPSMIKKIDDLRKLPIINKEVLKGNYPNFFSIEFKNVLHKLWYKSSSGSTGRPLLIYYDDFAKDYLDAVYLRALMNVGYKPNKPLFYYWYKPFRPEFYNMFGFMRKIYISSKMSDYQIIEEIKKHKPEYIYFYGGILFSISKKILEKEITLDWKPKSIITHAELFTDKMKEVVKDAFKTNRVFDQYGTSEFNRVAWQCTENEGYHVDIDSVIPEILDENGEEVSPKEKGNLILTGLINRALPLIRYDIGDVVIKNEEDKCSCGVTFPNIIKSILGRKKDFIGKISPAQILNVLYDIRGLSVFQIIRDNGKLLILVDSDNKFDERLLKKRIGKILNLSDSQISIRYGKVEKTAGGKRPFISSNINPSISHQYREANIFVYNF